jgi:hypothetical protein
MNCISCNKKLKHLYRSKDMVAGGIVETIYAGYGSEFDGEKFKIAVCDGCLKSKLIDCKKKPTPAKSGF